MAKHFFIIGAQRSGTTYLSNVLDSHPEISMAKPIKPEPKYFLNPDHADNSYQAYFNQYFADAGNVEWLGEKSTSYIECEKSAIAIKQVIPDATIIAILRNPIERAISNYYFTKEHGLEPYDIVRAIQDESLRVNTWQTIGTSVSPYAYIERGKYAQYLRCWEKQFGRDKLILLVAEQFIANSNAISALYDRLGIDRNYVPPGLAKRINTGSAKRHKFKLPEQLKTSLQAMFRPLNSELEKLYGLDLSCWDIES